MSRSATRRYRVRFAVQGATDISTSTLDFTLNVPDLAAIPYVGGSFVHLIESATELRPVTVLGVDYLGALIAAFAEDTRWTAIGRVVDIQWQDTADDPDDDATWTTYGTGRCSGLDELDGPGLFRIEISDETFISRRGAIFGEADTTQLWPAGLRYEWRGFGLAPVGAGVRTGNTGDVYHIAATGPGSPGFQTYERGIVSQGLSDYIRNDNVPPQMLGPSRRNFKHLRAVYDDIEYDVVGFSPVSYGGQPTAGVNTFTVDILWAGIPFVIPPATGDLYLYAPTAEPSDGNPLHVGVVDDHHIWGYPGPPTGIAPRGGYLHPADLCRRFCEQMGIRYNTANFDVIEADVSFPLLAPYVLETPDNPQEWLQKEVLVASRLAMLRDGEGRMRLVDLRPPNGFPLVILPPPPPPPTPAASLTILDETNSKDHRWRLSGGETMNSLNIEWATYGDLNGGATYISPAPAVSFGYFGFTNPFGVVFAKMGTPEGIRGDYLERRIDVLGPFEDPNVEYLGRQSYTMSWHSPMEPLEPNFFGAYNLFRILSISGLSLRGAYFYANFIGSVLAPLVLTPFRDGPMLGTAEISGTLAETMEEGDYVLVDCSSVKVANPFTAARFGKVLVLLLSITRYPAHAEIEYLVFGQALAFACPDPDDPTSWLLSPLNEAATTVLSFMVPEPLSAELLTFYIQAAKNQAGGQTVNMDVVLRFGGPAGLEVASWSVSDVSETATDYAFTLDASQQALITDWTLLFLEIGRSGDVGDTDPSVWRRLIISGIWI